MKQSSYTDEHGRTWATLLPDGIPDYDASMGLPIGPPSLASLNLPIEIEVRLHNQLYNRGMFTYADAQARRMDIFAALQAALRIDIEAVVQLYNRRDDDTSPAVSSNGKSPVAAKRRKREG